MLLIFVGISLPRKFQQISTTHVSWSMKYRILKYLSFPFWVKDSFLSQYRYNLFVVKAAGSFGKIRCSSMLNGPSIYSLVRPGKDLNVFAHLNFNRLFVCSRCYFLLCVQWPQRTRNCTLHRVKDQTVSVNGIIG